MQIPAGYISRIIQFISKRSRRVAGSSVSAGAPRRGRVACTHIQMRCTRARVYTGGVYSRNVPFKRARKPPGGPPTERSRFFRSRCATIGGSRNARGHCSATCFHETSCEMTSFGRFSGFLVDRELIKLCVNLSSRNDVFAVRKYSKTSINRLILKVLWVLSDTIFLSFSRMFSILKNL